jgi:hypothetical protein
VGAEGEPDLVLCQQYVVAADAAESSVNPLVYGRYKLSKVPSFRVESQVPVCVNAERVHSLEGETHLVHVGTRRECDVVFEISASAVEDEVHPGINLRVAHARELRDPGMPVGRLADQIIAAAGQRRFAGYFCSPAPAFELHRDREIPAARHRQFQRCALVGEEHASA